MHLQSAWSCAVHLSLESRLKAWCLSVSALMHSGCKKLFVDWSPCLLCNIIQAQGADLYCFIAYLCFCHPAYGTCHVWWVFWLHLPCWTLHQHVFLMLSKDPRSHLIFCSPVIYYSWSSATHRSAVRMCVCVCFISDWMPAFSHY